MSDGNAREKKVEVNVLGESTALAPSDLYDVELKGSLFGFNKKEVKAKMASAADDIEKLLEENRALRQKIEEQAREIAEYRRNEENLKKALVTSEQMRTDILAHAKTEAGLITNEAEAAARRMREEAETDARRILDEAEHAARQTRLEQERVRNAIESQIAELTLQRERFRTELLALMEAHRRLLEAEYGAGTANGDR